MDNLYFKSKLLPYDESLAHNLILNTNQIEYYIWLEIPSEITLSCVLVEVYDITLNKEVAKCRVPYHQYIKREDRKPWLQIGTDMFDLSPGQHMYRFQFVNTSTDDIISLYFTYTIQTDTPNKPYIYNK